MNIYELIWTIHLNLNHSETFRNYIKHSQHETSWSDTTLAQSKACCFFLCDRCQSWPGSWTTAGSCGHKVCVFIKCLLVCPLHRIWKTARCVMRCGFLQNGSVVSHLQEKANQTQVSHYINIHKQYKQHTSKKLSKTRHDSTLFLRPRNQCLSLPVLQFLQSGYTGTNRQISKIPCPRTDVQGQHCVCNEESTWKHCVAFCRPWAIPKWAQPTDGHKNVWVAGH